MKLRSLLSHVYSLTSMFVPVSISNGLEWLSEALRAKGDKMDTFLIICNLVTIVCGILIIAIGANYDELGLLLLHFFPGAILVALGLIWLINNLIRIAGV